MKCPSRIFLWVTSGSVITGFGIGWLLRSFMWPKHHIAKDEPHESPMPAGLLGDMNRADPAPQINHLNAKVATLLEEYDQLLEQYHKATDDARQEELIAIYYALETTLLQLPVLAHDLQQGATIDYQMLAGLLESIPRRLQAFGLQQVGHVGERTAFDPAIHEPLSTEGLLTLNTPVIVATPGFRYEANVLARAQVAPAGQI